MGIMFPRLGKIVPHAKLYSLTNGKYIPTTGKIIFTDKNMGFRQWELCIHDLVKIAENEKLCASTSGKYVFNNEKSNTYKLKNFFFLFKYYTF